MIDSLNASNVYPPIGTNGKVTSWWLLAQQKMSQSHDVQGIFGWRAKWLHYTIFAHHQAKDLELQCNFHSPFSNDTTTTPFPGLKKLVSLDPKETLHFQKSKMWNHSNIPSTSWISKIWRIKMREKPNPMFYLNYILCSIDWIFCCWMNQILYFWIELFCVFTFCIWIVDCHIIFSCYLHFQGAFFKYFFNSKIILSNVSSSCVFGVKGLID